MARDRRRSQRSEGWEPDRASDRARSDHRRGAARPDADQQVVAVSLVAGLLAGGLLIGAAWSARSLAAAAAAVVVGADSVAQVALLAAGHKVHRDEQRAGPRHPLAGRRARFYWPAVLGVAAATAGVAGIGLAVARSAGAAPVPGVALGLASGALVCALLIKGMTAFLAGVALTAERGSFLPELTSDHPAPSLPRWLLIQLRRGPHPSVGMVARQDVIAIAGLLPVAGLVVAGAVVSDGRYDGWAALATLGWLVVALLAHFLHMRALVAGGAVPRVTREAVAAVVDVEPAVRRLVHVESHHVGPDEVLVAARVELVEGLALAEVVEVVDRLRHSVARAVPGAEAVYVEPGITAPPPMPVPEGFANGGTYVWTGERAPAPAVEGPPALQNPT